MQSTTASAVDDKDNTIAYVVADNRMKTGITFSDIVRGNQSPKSVASVNPVIPDQKKHVTQKKQVAWFTLAWRNLYLDSCATYHTAFVTCLLNNVEDDDTNLAGNYNAEVTSSSIKRYYGEFHM